MKPFKLIGFIILLQCKIVSGQYILKKEIGFLQLNIDTSRFFLTDLANNAKRIDKISIANSKSKSKLLWTKGEDVLTIISHENDRLLEVNFCAGSICETVVFKQSLKKRYTFSFTTKGSYKEVYLVGDFNGWNPKITPLKSTSANQWSTQMVLPEGNTAYKIVTDGVWMNNPQASDSISNGQGAFNSVIKIGKPDLKPHIISKSYELGIITIVANHPKVQLMALVDNQPARVIQKNGNEFRIDISKMNLKTDKSLFKAIAFDENGWSNDILIPIENKVPILNANVLDRTDKRSMTMYFMMVDRFVNGNKNNDRKVDDPEILDKVNFWGGDLEGIRQKVQSGYFKQLGINTLWLSPIIKNPDNAYGEWKNPKTKFSGYHGYWPVSSSLIDARFGTDNDLNKLLQVAHNANTNILLDYVANHVHQEHPLYQKNRDWATSLYLPDGTKNTEKWDEHRLTTWFDDFLPTLDFSKPEVLEAMTDSAVYWFKKFPIDGFRHDATKHIQNEFWQKLTYKLYHQVVVPEKRNIYQIGETYGSPELISGYLGPGMLDGQFDFNLYDAAVNIFSSTKGDLNYLKSTVNQSLAYYGSHHLMGNITGNQDRTRFISYADGSVKFDENPKQAGWDREIVNKDVIGFKRLENLIVFVSTIPGIPVIYYGDEIGLPGANDPDNRRMMIFDELNENQQKLKTATAEILNFRKTNLPLIYGEFKWIESPEGAFIYRRNYLGKQTFILFNRSDKSVKVKIPVSEIQDINRVKAFKNSYLKIENDGLLLQIAPESYEILFNP
jgi:glycosidase